PPAWAASRARPVPAVTSNAIRHFLGFIIAMTPFYMPPRRTEALPPEHFPAAILTRGPGGGCNKLVTALPTRAPARLAYTPRLTNPGSSLILLLAPGQAGTPAGWAAPLETTVM